MRWMAYAGFSLALASTALFAAAQEPPADGDKSSRGKELFAKLDANGDGQLEASEVPEQQQRLFERLVRTSDKNGDGKLSAEEFAAGTTTGSAPDAAGGDGQTDRGRRGGNLEAVFARLDKNGDGKVTKDEIPEAMRDRIGQVFERVDADKDGALTKDEISKVGENARQRLAGMAGGPGGPPGGRLFAALDANRDGKISSQEIAVSAESLKKLDRNGDGAITREEIGGPPPRTDAAGPPAGRMLERLAQADADKDGKLSEQELPERLRPQFKALDGNADGFIDKAELESGLGKLRELMRGDAGKAKGRGPGRFNPEQMLKSADKNGDGKISKEEAPERLQQAFSRLDANGDGVLDQDELKAVAERFRAMKRAMEKRGKSKGGEEPE